MNLRKFQIFFYNSHSNPLWSHIRIVSGFSSSECSQNSHQNQLWIFIKIISRVLTEPFSDFSSQSSCDFYQNLLEILIRILIRVLIRTFPVFSSESLQSSYQNLWWIPIGIFSDFSWKPSRDFQQNLSSTFIKILPHFSSESFFVPGFSSDSSQGYHQIHLQILIRMLS